MKTLILSLFLSFCAASCDRQQPQQAAQQHPGQTTMTKHYPKFDGGKSFDLLTAQTAFGPRNVNSTGHQKCLEYLNAELKKNADSVALQPFTQNGYNETLRLTNIFASFQPQNKERILLLAHWDTRPRAEMDANSANKKKPILGANDGASGVAVLLELSRLLKENPPPIGVDILLTDGEDYGDAEKDGNTDMYFLGARYFAKTKSPLYNPRFGILLDMIGDRDLQIPMERNSMHYAPQVVSLVWQTAADAGVSAFVNIPGDLPISDDHLPLNEAGIPTIDIIDFDYPHWHTVQDTPDKCSAESLESVGTVLSSLIYTKMGK